MKLPDIAFRNIKDPGFMEWADYVRIILNLGRYQFRIVGSEPTWAAEEGEAVIYVSGNLRRFYFYMGGAWYYIGWNSAGAIAGSLSDADGDTMVQVEETTDEDIIRFDTGDTQGGSAGERATIDYLGLALTDGLRLTLDGRGGDTYSYYDSGTEYHTTYVDGIKRMEM